MPQNRDPNKMHKCETCGITYTYQRSLWRHRKSHCGKASGYNKYLEKKFPCPQCHNTYAHYRNLWRHLKYECGKEPQYKCPHCPHVTKHKDHLQVHLNTHRSDKWLNIVWKYFFFYLYQFLLVYRTASKLCVNDYAHTYFIYARSKKIYRALTLL